MRARAWFVGVASLVAMGGAASSAGTVIVFGTTVPLASPDYPVGALVADVTGDGKADVVLAASRLTHVNVYAGNGDGTFAAVAQPATAVAYDGRMRSARLNADAADDLVLGDLVGSGPIHPRLDVLLSNGAGGFTQTSYAAASDELGWEQEVPALADWNGDGRIDIVTGSTAGVIRVRLNDGSGTFGAPQTVFAPQGPPVQAGDVVAADIDGDGRTDVVTSRGVLWRQGDGSLVQGPALTFRGQGLAAVDVDGDGLPDLVGYDGGYVGSAQAWSVVVYRHTAARSFAAAEAYSLPGSQDAPFDIAVADLNGDARPEIVTSTHVFVNTGTGLYGTAQPLPKSVWGGVAVGNVDADARPDVVVTDVNDGTTPGSLFPVRSATPAPFIGGLAPASLAAGASHEVVVTGSGFHAGSTLDFGADVTVGAVTFDSSGSVRADVAISASAALGVRTVTLHDPSDGDAAIAFRVTPATPVVGPGPTIASVTPGSAHAGDTLDVTVAGTQFTGGISVGFGAGAVVHSVTLVATGSIRVNLTLAASAPLGAHDVTLTTGAGGALAANAFEVLPPRSLDVAVEKGRIRPGARAGRGSLTASGTFAFNGLSPDGVFHPLTESAQIRFGDPSAPVVVDIQPDQGWRLRRSRAEWRSAKGAAGPRVDLVLDAARHTFKLTVDRANLTLPASGDVLVEFTLGGETGSSVRHWASFRHGVGLVLK